MTDTTAPRRAANIVVGGFATNRRSDAVSFEAHGTTRKVSFCGSAESRNLSKRCTQCQSLVL